MNAEKWAELLAKTGWSCTRNYRNNKRYEKLLARKDATRIVLNRGQFVVEVYWSMRGDWWRWEVSHHRCPMRTLGDGFEGMCQGRSRAKRWALKMLAFAKADTNKPLLAQINSMYHRLHTLPY